MGELAPLPSYNEVTPTPAISLPLDGARESQVGSQYFHPHQVATSSTLHTPSMSVDNMWGSLDLHSHK